MSYNYPRTLIALGTVTASSSASLSFTTQFTSNFSQYYLAVRNLLPATDAVSLNVTVSTDNGSSYLSTNYRYELEDITSNANAIVGSTSASSGLMAKTLSSTSSHALNGDYYLLGMNRSVQFVMRGFGCHYNSSSFYNFTQGVITNSGTTATNAIKFAMSAGNIASGTITLYGVVEP